MYLLNLVFDERKHRQLEKENEHIVEEEEKEPLI
jgi:hypothetical protein